MKHKLIIGVFILATFSATCFAEFPEKGVISVSPNKQYAILSRQPWYAYPLNLLSYATGAIPGFSKVSMIDSKGHRVFRHIELAGDWSEDSECYGGRKSDNHVALYFPKTRKKIETNAFVWAKGNGDDVFLIDFTGWGPANSRVWQSENPKEREIHFNRINLADPIPQAIGEFTMPRNTEAIVCMKSCGEFIRFGYSYSIYENANPIVVNDPNSSTFVSGRIALCDLQISSGKIAPVSVIKTTPEMRKACDCPK